jgi:regulatory protein
MIITAIERHPKRRSRVEVFLDGVAAFEIAARTAAKQSLHPGLAVEQSDIDALLAVESRRLALEAAAAMLARRPRSEQEIRRRLRQRKHDVAIIDETVSRLRELRLIDDAEFARAYTETRDRISPRGRRLIRIELRSAGVDQSLAADASELVDDADAAERYARTRMKSLATLDYQAFRNKLGSQLQRRGFGWEVARRVVERLWRELHPDGETPDGDWT